MLCTLQTQAARPVRARGACRCITASGTRNVRGAVVAGGSTRRARRPKFDSRRAFRVSAPSPSRNIRPASRGAPRLAAVLASLLAEAEAVSERIDADDGPNRAHYDSNE